MSRYRELLLSSLALVALSSASASAALVGGGTGDVSPFHVSYDVTLNAPPLTGGLPEIVLFEHTVAGWGIVTPFHADAGPPGTDGVNATETVLKDPFSRTKPIDLSALLDRLKVLVH